jgi:hypothetical protein
MIFANTGLSLLVQKILAAWMAVVQLIAKDVFTASSGTSNNSSILKV